MPIRPYDEIARDELRWLNSYWTAKRGDRAMPRHADIDPLEMVKLLPSLSIVDRPDGEFRIRLCGTWLTEIYGRDLTGAVVCCETLGDSADYWLSIHEAVFAGRVPLFGSDTFFWTGRKHIGFEWGAFPIADDGGGVVEELWCLIFDGDR